MNQVSTIQHEKCLPRVPHTQALVSSTGPNRCPLRGGPPATVKIEGEENNDKELKSLSISLKSPAAFQMAQTKTSHTLASPLQFLAGPFATTMKSASVPPRIACLVEVKHPKQGTIEIDGASVPLLNEEGYSTPSGSGTAGIEANLQSVDFQDARTIVASKAQKQGHNLFTRPPCKKEFWDGKHKYVRLQNKSGFLLIRLSIPFDKACL